MVRILLEEGHVDKELHQLDEEVDASRWSLSYQHGEASPCLVTYLNKPENGWPAIIIEMDGKSTD